MTLKTLKTKAEQLPDRQDAGRDAPVFDVPTGLLGILNRDLKAAAAFSYIQRVGREPRQLVV